MEQSRGTWWLDLVVVGLAASVPVALVATGVESTPIRLLAGIPLVLFLPGYALVSALYPGSREDCDPPLTRETGEGIDKTMRSRIRGLTGVDRFGVSVAASAALVPGVALLHYLASGSIGTVELAVGLGTLTWAFVFMALARRLRRPPTHRFSVSLSWPAALYGRYFSTEDDHLGESTPYEASDLREVGLNVVVACTLLVALTTAAYAFTQPPPSQEHDELAVVTTNETGEYVADDYPDDLEDADPLYVAVTNEYDHAREYVVRATLEVVSDNGTVLERDEQLRRTVELDPGERTHVRHDPADSLDGDRLRLRYTLEAAGETERNGSDDPLRSVHVWITDERDATRTPETPGSTTTPSPNGTGPPADGTTPTPTSDATPTAADDGFEIGL